MGRLEYGVGVLKLADSHTPPHVSYLGSSGILLSNMSMMHISYASPSDRLQVFCFLSAGPPAGNLLIRGQRSRSLHVSLILMSWMLENAFREPMCT